jgi:hypothetical protein
MREREREFYLNKSTLGLITQLESGVHQQLDVHSVFLEVEFLLSMKIVWAKHQQQQLINEINLAAENTLWFSLITHYQEIESFILQRHESIQLHDN